MKHIAMALALWGAVGCNEGGDAAETTGVSEGSLSNSGPDTTGGPSGPSCAASEECSGGVCAAEYVDVTMPLEFQCISGCVADNDASLWCRDDGSCCNAASTCAENGYCVPGAGTTTSDSNTATSTITTTFDTGDASVTVTDTTTDDTFSTSTTDDSASSDSGTTTGTDTGTATETGTTGTDSTGAT